jgi:hypothetical protein
MCLKIGLIRGFVSKFPALLESPTLISQVRGMKREGARDETHSPSSS